MSALLASSRTSVSAAVIAAIAAAALTACGNGPGVSDEAGETSAPAQPSEDALDAEIAALEQAVAAAEREVERLRDVHEIQNISSAYGHYVDQSMHDDVADLFAEDSVVEILGRGVFIGQERVREYMHNLGPLGPQPGLLFNHMHLQPIVHIGPDGETANVRSRALIMFGVEGEEAQWGNAIYENVFVEQDGVWKLDYLHSYQTFYTQYEDGWAERSSPIFAPYERLPPDAPQSVPYEPYPAAFVPPFHYTNPVTNRDTYTADPSYTPAQQDR